MKTGMTQKLTRAFSALPRKHNRHRTLNPLYKFNPMVAYDAFVAPSAALCGEVYLDNCVSVWDNTVIRGDLNSVAIGEGSTIFENCSLSTTHSLLASGEVAELAIEDGVIVMPGSSLISCTISENCYIGSGSVVCEGSKIGQGSILGAHSVVPPGRYIPAGQVWAGNPARFVKHVEKPESVALFMMRSEYPEQHLNYVSELLEHPDAYLQKEIEEDREPAESENQGDQEGRESEARTREEARSAGGNEKAGAN